MFFEFAEPIKNKTPVIKFGILDILDNALLSPHAQLHHSVYGLGDNIHVLAVVDEVDVKI